MHNWLARRWTRMVLLATSGVGMLLCGCPLVQTAASAPQHDSALVAKWHRSWSYLGRETELQALTWDLAADGTGTEWTMAVQTGAFAQRSLTWATSNNELTINYPDSGDNYTMLYELNGNELKLDGFDDQTSIEQVLVKDSTDRDDRLVGDWFMTDAVDLQRNVEAYWGAETTYSPDGSVEFLYDHEWVDNQPTYTRIDLTWFTSGNYVLYTGLPVPDMKEAHPYTLSADGNTLTIVIPDVEGDNTLVAYRDLDQHDTAVVGQWQQTGRTQDGVAQTFEPVTWTFSADGSGARDFQTSPDDTFTWGTTGTQLFIHKIDPSLLGFGSSVQYAINGNTLTLSYTNVVWATGVNMVDTYQKQ